MKPYVRLVQNFAARVVLLHSAVAAKLGLHLTDLKCLRLLGDKALSPGDLGEHVGLSGPAVTALIDRLEKAGYVTRERGTDDRRRISVRALPQKVREVDDLYAGQYTRMSRLLSKYSSEEFDVIVNFLEQTTEVLVEETKKLRKNQDIKFHHKGTKNTKGGQIG
jgi:DNA-binding MarR family transcriptional regulator